MWCLLTSVLVFWGLLSSEALDESGSSREAYAAWAQSFSRQTSDAGFIKWRQSLERIREINEIGLSWTAGLTKFADMTPEEFKETMLLRDPLDVRALEKKKEKTIKKEEIKTARTVTDTANFDWRDEGAVTPVQDQGFVGTCWSFSTIANVEGVTFLATNSSMKLAEEYLVDCDGTADYDLNHADCSVFGGWPYLAYQFIIKSGGVPSAQDVPYVSSYPAYYPSLYALLFSFSLLL